MKPNIPAVPDLARAKGSSVEEMTRWFIDDYYNKPVIPWNYLRSIKIVAEAYRGVHNLGQLLAGCEKERIEQGKISNREVVELAAPLAFDRQTSVFNLPRQKFPFGRDLQAGYRVPFFITENGIVKLYFLQPRKGAALDLDQLGMVATIHKEYLLDTEFFGIPCDLEYVDLSAHPKTNERQLRTYRLEELPLWSEKRLSDRLTLIAESLEAAFASGEIKQKQRPRRQPDKEMPLFD